MSKLANVIAGFSVALALSSVAVAGQKEDAVTQVTAAAKAVQANRAGGLAAIQSGKFASGEVYVFAYDLNGVMLAHPKTPRLVGRNMLDQPDVDGKYFRKEIIEKAKSVGSGWVDYVYKNPDTGAIEAKTTYLKKENDVVVCAGVYK